METRTSEANILREEVIDDLNKTLRKFHNKEIDALELLSFVQMAWRRAIKNGDLNKKIVEEFRRKRIALHQIAQINIQEQGDPVLQRYNPNYWMSNVPQELRGKEEIYLVDRIQSLRGFFENLTP